MCVIVITFWNSIFDKKIYLIKYKYAKDPKQVYHLDYNSFIFYHIQKLFIYYFS